MPHIKMGEQDGHEYPFLTCPKCKHNFFTWETVVTGGYMQQTGFIDSYTNRDGDEFYVKGESDARMNGNWNAEHYCERCNADITGFIDEVFGEI